MSRWDDFRQYHPPSVPLPARGGIKAQSKRGTFGESWWAKRWIAVLESFHLGARLRRGRGYARQGQVLALTIEKGSVTATVQGSRPQPYAVRIAVTVLTATNWKKAAKTLSSQARFAAQLLAGEMPQGIEQAFEAAGLSLFPAQLRDLQTDCSCPDWANPCKHIAAVYYLLGEEFHRDPFLIFKLRGLNREELIDLLGGIGRSTTGRKVPRRATGAESEEAPGAPEPLLPDIAAFWGEHLADEDFLGATHIPPVPASLPKRLGPFPFWRGEDRFLDTLERIYASASPLGLRVVLGECDRNGNSLSTREPESAG
ncbi:MAG: SWIM zinc finger family protein [Nitrospiraceae bacterium]